MTLQDRLEQLQSLAKAEVDGDASAHHKLLQGIRELQQAAETPIETTSRLNFQVCDEVEAIVGCIADSFQMLQIICLRIAVERELLHAMVCRDGPLITADELHASTGTDPLLIGKSAVFRVQGFMS